MFTYKINEDTELRLLEVRHAEALFALTDESRSYLKEWLPWLDFTQTVNDSKQYIEGTLKQFSSNNGFQAGIWYKGELAGVIGLHSINWANQSTSIGYWLGKKFQGNGFMTIACKALVDYCFSELKLNRIEIRVATENVKSQKIPQRIGFQKEGCIRNAEWLYDKFVDHYVFGLLREEYNNKELLSE
ncbi:GNAT family N-acetyltransferase [Ureibacillus manganicus]|uniref:Alanine acetyltransferase n=1 Tax=Ureibacillus manganicus DSM 26584 TaxID=1384049 RepID=A0A0A3I1P7_9BACL|nr:GNAT family protein [Ureibacillus manganicus]KGR77405.1 alanine acetyltransferase [Ureibacillus manganicus DSM 26584]